MLWTASRDVFNEWAEKSFQPVRLIGMAARSLVGQGGQMPLFADASAEKHQRLDRVVDKIVDRFGSSSVRRGMSRD